MTSGSSVLVEEFREYIANLDVTVTAPNEAEAVAALERSGIRPGVLIGEALIGNVEPPEEL